MTRQPAPRRHAVAAAAAVALLLSTTGAKAVTFNWSTGTFAAGVTAPSPLPLADVLNINAGGNKFFDGSVSNFSNGGTVNWNADPLYFQSGAAVTNSGLWNATSDQSMFYNGGTGPSFNNTGTFRKSGGAGSTTVNGSVGFVNSGTLDAQTGTLNFAGGSTFNGGSVFTGAGTVAMNSGTNTFNGAFTSSNLLLSSGTFLGNGAALGGTVRFTGGSLSGTWAVGSGQTLRGEAGGNKFIDGASTIVTNNGTIAWNTGDALYLQSGATLRNQALFVANNSASVFYNGGAGPAFTNSNTGTVRAAAGVTLTLNNSTGFANNGGTLDAASGGAIVYASGSTFNSGTQFTGAGSNVAAGNNTFNNAFTSANLVLQSGVHTGGNAVVNGSVSYTGGNLSGTWMVAAGQTLNGNGGGNKFIDGASTIVTNNGTIAWNTGDALYLQGGATLRNQALFVANNSASVFYNGGAGPAFTNSNTGTVRAAAGVTLTLNNSTGFVNNGGTLDAASGGAIVYASGSTFNSGTQFTGAGSNVAAGNNTFNNAFSSANLVLQGGVHTGGDAVVNGRVSYTGGNLSGAWTVAAGQTLNGNAGGNKSIDGASTTVTNSGTIAWNTGDALYLTSGATLRNQGLMNFNANASVFYNGGSGPSFVNTGLITKTGAAGTTTIGGSLGFDNLGTIDVQVGTFALPPNFTNNGTLMGLGTYSVAGTLTNAGTVAPGASPGTLNLSGNYAQAAGGTFAVELQSTGLADRFNISGTAALGGQLAISCFAACSLGVGDVVTILDSNGALTGTFSSVALSGFATGAFDVIYDTANTRVQLVVTQAVTAVPEPGTWALWLAGLAVLGGLARRRTSAAV